MGIKMSTTDYPTNVEGYIKFPFGFLDIRCRKIIYTLQSFRSSSTSNICPETLRMFTTRNADIVFCQLILHVRFIFGDFIFSEFFCF